MDSQSRVTNLDRPTPWTITFEFDGRQAQVEGEPFYTDDGALMYVIYGGPSSPQWAPPFHKEVIDHQKARQIREAVKCAIETPECVVEIDAGRDDRN
jgi:hypothetical protein